MGLPRSTYYDAPPVKTDDDLSVRTTLPSNAAKLATQKL
jgi:hypothetical protein